MNSALRGRFVIIAPRLQDAVLSLGATIANAAREGSNVEIVTVFSSQSEDQFACSLLGASAHWLSVDGIQCDATARESYVVDAVQRWTADADVIAIPGVPLVNAGDAWISEILLRRGLDHRRVALYAEQPAWFKQRRQNSELCASARLQPFLNDIVRWTLHGSTAHDRNAKRMAARAYGSHRMRTRMPFSALNRLLGYEFTMGGEPLGWID